jgi:hypothetical protein
MSKVDDFRRVVEQHTGGNTKKALPLRDYLTMMGITYEIRRASARAQLTREMKPGGRLRDLVDKGLVLADVANRQPECFEGVQQAASTLPVVIQDGPVADLRTFPGDHLTEEASDARKAVVIALSTTKMAVRTTEGIARDVSRILFEVERQKLRADAYEREAKLQAKHNESLEEMNRSLAQALQTLGGHKQAAE